MVGAMQKSVIMFVMMFVLITASYAQVEQAVRYRVQGLSLIHI